MYRDLELPNGFQDADFEMAELQRVGNLASALRKRGICTHGWLQGPPGKQVTTCLHCGKEFASSEEAFQEGRRLLA